MLLLTESICPVCVSCKERPVEHRNTSQCHRCYQRDWRAARPGYEKRTGKRAEQKRRWDREAARRRREEQEAA